MPRGTPALVAARAGNFSGRPARNKVLESLESLAVSCGFRDLSHLRRANRHAFGRPPAATRENEALIRHVLLHKRPFSEPTRPRW